MVDCGGFEIGAKAEREGVLRAAIAPTFALSHLTTPRFVCILGRCFGVGGGLLASRGHNGSLYVMPKSSFGSLVNFSKKKKKSIQIQIQFKFKFNFFLKKN